jgi:hypothetical protein
VSPRGIAAQPLWRPSSHRSRACRATAARGEPNHLPGRRRKKTRVFLLRCNRRIPKAVPRFRRTVVEMCLLRKNLFCISVGPSTDYPRRINPRTRRRFDRGKFALPDCALIVRCDVRMAGDRYAIGIIFKILSRASAIMPAPSLRRGVKERRI